MCKNIITIDIYCCTLQIFMKLLIDFKYCIEFLYKQDNTGPIYNTYMLCKPTEYRNEGK